MRPTDYDRMLCSDAEGKLIRVFAPRWWQLWRWLWWMTAARRKPRGVLTFRRLNGEAIDLRFTHEGRVKLPGVPHA